MPVLYNSQKEIKEEVMNRDRLLQLKHVLITASQDEYDQLLAVVTCPENDYAETVILTKSDTYTFECEHGTSRMPIRVAGDFTTFVVGDDHFFPKPIPSPPKQSLGFQLPDLENEPDG